MDSRLRQPPALTAVLAVLAFGSELAMLVAFPLAGWSHARWPGLVGGIVISGAVAALWGARLAPRAARRWQGPRLWTTRMALIALAAGALAVSRHPLAAGLLLGCGWLGQLGANPSPSGHLR